MKYILMMSSTKAGVSAYHTWSQSDRDTHMQTLGTIVKELVETGEFVATQGLAEPKEAKVVRGEKNGLADDGWHLPRIEGVPAGLLDCRCGHARARLRHRRPNFGGTGTGRYSD